MPRTKFSSRLKLAVFNMMQALGSAASHMASNAKLRVTEINLQSRRHEILTESSLQAFELWHSGVKLPKELADMFKELSEIDDKLSILRAQKYAKVKVDAEETAEDSEEALPDANGKETPVCVPPAATTEPKEEKQETPAPAKPAARKTTRSRAKKT